MANPRPTLETVKNQALKRLRWPLALTRGGMLVERLARAFWPFATVLMVVLAALMLEAHQITVSRSVALGAVALVGGALLGTFGWGIYRMRWPAGAEAFDRLDRSLSGRPITALGDIQAIGADDGASQRVWRTHVERMADRVASVKAVAPEVRVADKDRFGLRLMAATVLAAAVS